MEHSRSSLKEATQAGTGFLSGHADGSIVRWYVAEDQQVTDIQNKKSNLTITTRFTKHHDLNPQARKQGKVVVHSIPPYALAWASSHICVAGPDKKVKVDQSFGIFYLMF